MCEEMSMLERKATNEYKKRLNEIYIIPVWRATAPPLIIKQKSWKEEKL